MATRTLSTGQPSEGTAPVQQGVADVRLRFAQLKVAFTQMRIVQPLVFIQWKRPELTPDEVRRIRMGLSGRAAASDGHLAEKVAHVIEQLQAA